MKKIFFVFLFSVFSILTSPFARASDLFFLPEGTKHQKGETFLKSLYIDTGNQEVNAVELEIIFNPDLLEVIDVITGDSLIKIWGQEPFISNEEGNVRFMGGIPNGFKGEGPLLTLIFRAKSPGDYNLTLSQVKVLLNDGKATQDEVNPLLNNSQIIERIGGSIEITSSSHPDENEWQDEDVLSLHWNLVEGTDYSYILSKDSEEEPDKVPDVPEGELVWMGSMSYESLEDGIYYFHLKQKTSDGEWSPKTTIRAMIDVTNPEEFELKILEIEGEKYLVFSSIDSTSGIDHYEISTISLTWDGKVVALGEETEWKIVQSPYLLDNNSLRSIVRVKAVDKAGNERISEIVLYSGSDFPFRQAIFFFSCTLVFVVLALWIIFLRKIRKK